LRQQVLGIYRLFDRIREQLPELVIENCSSGGHRLEPSLMLGRTAISSSSDAHELPEIPIIAANLQKLILPRQSSIWAVLHAADSMERMTYTLSATFLGRMCLSGELSHLSPDQWSLVRRAQSLYAKAAEIIKNGRSELRQEIGPSWRYPKGRQSVVRLDKTGTNCIAVLHHFETDSGQGPWTVELPPLSKAEWRLEDAFCLPTFEFDFKEGIIRVTKCPAFSGAVFLAHKS
jgi:alpha-galactosidase